MWPSQNSGIIEKLAKEVNDIIVPNACQLSVTPSTLSTMADKCLLRRSCANNRNTLRMVLPAHVEGSSLRGISRTVNLAYNTVFSLVRAASEKGQMIHNAHVQDFETSQISSDEFWSLCTIVFSHCARKCTSTNRNKVFV